MGENQTYHSMIDSMTNQKMIPVSTANHLKRAQKKQLEKGGTRPTLVLGFGAQVFLYLLFFNLHLFVLAADDTIRFKSIYYSNTFLNPTIIGDA